MRLLLSTLLFLSLVPVAFGQAALLTLPPGSASAALADAQVTQATAFSPLLNPAAMGALAGAEGGGSVLRFAGRTATFASGVVPLGARVRTGAYAGLFVAPDPLVDPQPGESATSQFQSGLLGAAISVQLGRFQAGGGAKVFVEDVGDTRATWLAYDVGGTATFGGGDVVVGAVLKNFGTALTGQTVYDDCVAGNP
ncbi:MAG TPA: hypothetical protein VD948_07375, partial [Rhodothermales bacterium]|nr:hypothetical protein [Rhodothermales bacterium]